MQRMPTSTAGADASVRVQATRVRQGLEDYYTGVGADDAIRITLPRGSYTRSLSVENCMSPGHLVCLA
jgi:hypothetical protein